MRRILLLVSISLLAGSSAYSPTYAQGYGNPPGYRAPPPPAPYTGSKDREPHLGRLTPGAGDPASGSQMSSSENCGTPDEPKPCPPMPRRPLSHYPNNKQ